MSPRAACRLATLGFDEVYDYVPGKVDWLAHGLPTEGESAGRPRAGAHVRDDVVTARLHDRVGDVAGRVSASPYGFALVVSDAGVLLGRLREAALAAGADALAEAVMEPGPSTVRPHAPLAELAERMHAGNLRTMVVSTPEGVLLGVLRREDAERALGPANRPDG